MSRLRKLTWQSAQLYHICHLACYACRVGVLRPSVEVRFQNLHAETEVYLDLSRNLPGFDNAIRNAIDVSYCFQGCLHILMMTIDLANTTQCSDASNR